MEIHFNSEQNIRQHQDDNVADAKKRARPHRTLVQVFILSSALVLSFRILRFYQQRISYSPENKPVRTNKTNVSVVLQIKCDVIQLNYRFASR